MKKKDLLLDVDEVICFSGYLEAVNDFLNTNYNIDDFDCYYIDEKVIPKERFKEFNEYVTNCKSLCEYDIPATATYGDELLTLSTCNYHTTNGRFVVVAKKIK